MANRGSMVKVIRKESAQDYVQTVLHMERVAALPSAESDYWFFKGRNENGEWMEIRIERKPDKNKLHNVCERKSEELNEDDFEWIDALPIWNGEPSDIVDNYIPGK